MESTAAAGGHFLRSGAVAGAASTFAFVVVHKIMISDIWFSLVIMLVAGALCGLCLGWTCGRLFTAPSLGSWLRYSTTFVAMFILLGVASALAFDPITPVAVLVDNDEPTGELIGKALPMSLAFTLLAALVIDVLFGRGWSHIGVVLLTCILLVATLGLSVSIIGLVAFPSGSLYLVAELFGLILALGVAFTIAFAALERKQLALR